MSPTILCVDDQPTGLHIRKLFLESFGYQVLCAGGGRTALDILQRQPVDAVILDYRMPEMDGDEVAREIKGMDPDLPIVLLSGYISEIPETLRKNVNGFVAKGSPPEELRRALASALGETPEKNPHTTDDALVESCEQAKRARVHSGNVTAHLNSAKKMAQENAVHLEERKRKIM